MCFKRVFVALKPCIDGFLARCRPYIGVDSTALNGKYKGQLAAAIAVDGHNWLFVVAYAVFDSETKKNWEWFHEQLHRAIGSPPNLVISSNACKGLETSIAKVFPEAECRECMRHFYSNFLKKYRGPVFTKNLYPAARAFKESKFRFHMEKIMAECPEAIEYLETYHARLWYRCGFGEGNKVDYLTNNVSESFNKQIKDFKGLNLSELVDEIYHLILDKFCIRREIGREMVGKILPSVIKQMNALSRFAGSATICRNDDLEGEVSLPDRNNIIRRFTVDLKKWICSCRVWQITGKPCIHALAFICSFRGLKIQDFVHEYYSMERFQVAYAGVIASMTDKSEWPKVDLGFKVHPPVQTKNVPGRFRKVRIRGWMEPMRRTVKCKRCKGFGHHQKTCKVPFKLDDEEEEEADDGEQKKPDDGEQEKPDDVEKQENPDDGEQQGLDGGEQKASEEVDPAPKEVQPATKRKKGAAKSQTKGGPPAKIGCNKKANAKSPTQGASQAKGKKNIVSNSTKSPAEGKKKAAAKSPSNGKKKVVQTSSAKSPTKGGKRKPKGTTPTKGNGSATITVRPEVITKRKLSDLIREK